MKRIIVLLATLLSCAVLSAQEGDKKIPVFTAASKESVMLRYRHTVGRKIVQHVNMVMKMDLDMGEEAGKMSVDMTMEMTGFYTVDKVNDDATVDVAYSIGRIALRTTAPMEMSYDSDGPADESPAFAKMRFYLNTPILMKIDARGKTLATDTSRIEAAAREAGEELTAEEIRVQVENFTKNTFTPLPERPVKTGDVFDAGVSTQTIQGLGEMTITLRYRVAAISADKKKVVLEPAVKLALAGSDLSRSRMTGWLLLDLDQGLLERSYLLMHLDLPFDQGGAVARLLSDSEIFFRSE